MDYGLAALFLVVLIVVIVVMISRWVFRINDIIYRLDLIVALLEDRFADDDTPKKKRRDVKTGGT
jgi:hypothetical protein